MIPQLKKRLDTYIRQSEKNDKEYREGKIIFEKYFDKRFEIDNKINAIFELQKRNIKDKEFSDSQINVWFKDIK